MKKLYDRKIEYLESIGKIRYDLKRNGVMFIFGGGRKKFFISSGILESESVSYYCDDYGEQFRCGGRINFKKFKRVINNLINY